MTSRITIKSGHIRFIGAVAEEIFKHLHPVIQCDGAPLSADLWADDYGLIYLRRLAVRGGRIELESLELMPDLCEHD